jgi:hypothetical protein
MKAEINRLDSPHMPPSHTLPSNSNGLAWTFRCYSDDRLMIPEKHGRSPIQFHELFQACDQRYRAMANWALARADIAVTGAAAFRAHHPQIKDATYYFADMPLSG